MLLSILITKINSLKNKNAFPPPLAMEQQGRNRRDKTPPSSLFCRCPWKEGHIFIPCISITLGKKLQLFPPKAILAEQIMCIIFPDFDLTKSITTAHLDHQWDPFHTFLSEGQHNSPCYIYTTWPYTGGKHKMQNFSENIKEWIHQKLSREEKIEATIICIFQAMNIDSPLVLVTYIDINTKFSFSYFLPYGQWPLEETILPIQSYTQIFKLWL